MAASGDIAIIGGGPAGMIAAETLARAGRRVVLYEAMPTLGRKFLMAGRGGLNLTHSEDKSAFLARYGEAASHLAPALDRFDALALRAWAEGLGQETFIGSSGRVFPRAMKASPLLRAWLARLAALGVEVRTRHRLVAVAPDGTLGIAGPTGTIEGLRPAAAILALGGASWPRLGSDGRWVAMLRAIGVDVETLRPANAAAAIAWSPFFAERFAGTALKRIALRSAARAVRGEALISAAGLEGGAVYALSRELREASEAGRTATLRIDLRPDESEDLLTARLSHRRPGASLSTHLARSLALPPVAVALLREVGKGAAPPSEPRELARRVKDVVLEVTGLAGIERAISTAGGVPFAALDGHFMLRARPGLFIAGEMLDWEAPTGGYLLQACFATGIAAAEGALTFLHE